MYFLLGGPKAFIGKKMVKTQCGSIGRGFLASGWITVGLLDNAVPLFIAKQSDGYAVPKSHH